MNNIQRLHNNCLYVYYYIYKLFSDRRFDVFKSSDGYSFIRRVWRLINDHLYCFNYQLLERNNLVEESIFQFTYCIYLHTVYFSFNYMMTMHSTCAFRDKFLFCFNEKTNRLRNGAKYLLYVANKKFNFFYFPSLPVFI